MRNIISQIGSILAAVGISLMAIGCGDKEKAAGGNADGKEKGSGSGGEKVDLEAQMIGYWVPNEEEMVALLEKEVADDPDAAAMLPMIKGMMTSMMIEVSEGEVVAHMMGQEDKSGYTVKATDPATNTLTLDVAEDDTTTSQGTAKIDGDRLILKKSGDGPGDTLILDRITKEQFEERKKAAPSGGFDLPGGVEPPIPAPDQE